MIFTLRFKDVKVACGKAVGLASTDSRVIDYVNRAIERLLHKGKWKGTTHRFHFCVPSDACVVWPREIETPEAIAIDKSPYKIRSGWYEFGENGPGVISSDSDLCKTLIDRGETCAFDVVVGTDKKLAVFCDRDEGTGKYIWLEFYDKNGQWVTTNDDGTVVAGEKLALPSTAGTYVYTSGFCQPSGLWRVKKSVTLGVVRLYEYNNLTGAYRPLGYYQPDEEIPVYRRSLIPSLANGSCDQTTVTVVAKLRFLPVSNDESWVMIGNREALRLACHAIKKEEDGIYDESSVNWGLAIQALNEQVAHHTGGGLRATLQCAPASEWGGGVVNLQ